MIKAVLVISIGLIATGTLVSLGYATEEHSEDEFERVVTATSSEAKAIPSWVDQNYIWYGEGLITQSELHNALKYLLDNNIMFISEDADALQKAAGKQQTITAHTDSEETPVTEKILTFLEGVEKSIHVMEGHAGQEHFIEKFGRGDVMQQSIAGIDQQGIAKSTLNVGGVKNAGLPTGPRSMGTPLTQVMSANVCGDTLCDKPMSMEEKIQMYLKSRSSLLH